MSGAGCLLISDKVDESDGVGNIPSWSITIELASVRNVDSTGTGRQRSTLGFASHGTGGCKAAQSPRDHLASVAVRQGESPFVYCRLRECGPDDCVVSL